MKSIRIPRPKAVLTHPEDPDLRVTVEKPTVADYLEWRSSVVENTKMYPAFKPGTDEPIRDVMGRLEAIPGPTNMPKGLLEEYLLKCIRNVSGISEAGAELRDIVRAFWEEPFTVHGVTREVERVRDGKVVKETEKFDQAFALWLLDKVNNGGTFKQLDPLEPTSAAPPSA